MALALLVVALTLLAGGWGSGALLAQTGPCTPPVVNPIPCENSQPGNPASEWDVTGDGDATIQGFATDISATTGQTVSFKVSTTAADYRLDIYRLGYYGGSGARKIATVQPSATLPQSQPACLTQAATGLVDCGNWAVSASWAVPAGAVSGIYLAKLVREAGAAGSSHIAFVVRDDEGRSDLLFQTADTTWQAYNSYGGNSLSTGSPAGRAYKVSYNRPFDTRKASPQDWLFNAEYPMVRWLEANGYHVSYSTGVDTDRRGAELLEHKAFLSVGHDEYWSGAQRANVEAARAAGVHLAFFSGNEVFWKTRWESSIDPSGTPYRTLVSYKETLDDAKIDPNAAWTGTWRDPRFSPPSDGGRPENALTGTIFTVDGVRDDALTVPAAYGNLRLWRNTTVATLPVGGTATFPAGTLGYEWDEDLDNGARPPGLIPLSSTTVNVTQRLVDYGSTYAAGPATHALTLYRHSSGALVFGAGTVQWSWGLDASHDRGSAAADVRMRQATVNLLADMGAQPATLQSGLVAATATTDTTPPSSVITAPVAGATLPVGTAVTISGTASDAGGVVGVVEVSVDGGTSWRRASGRTSWSLSWTPSASSTVVIKSRAVDDSGRIETPGAGVTVTVGAGGVTCPCSLFSATLTPAVTAANDSSAVELGVKFQASGNGFITALRFYKDATNTGTHTVSLWSTAGTRLATATVSGESASGWQQMALAAPLAVTAGTTYIASYHAPNGRYAVTGNAFDAAVVSGPLTAPASAASGGNGVYRYGASAYPDQSWLASNYWVDVVYVTSIAPDTTPPVISAMQAGAITASSATITWTTNEASDSQVEYGTSTAYGSTTPLDPAMVTGHSVAITGLTAGTVYNYRVKSKDAAGNVATSANGTFTTAAADTTAPVISAVQAGSLTMSGATITWTTNEASDSQVEYGTTTSYGSSTALNTAMVTNHSAALSGLAAGTLYNFRVKSRDAAGNLATSANATFTTTAPPSCPCSLFSATATPAVTAANDSSAVELGVKFQASGNGFITALRFYKDATNTGTHTVSLWNLAGTRLATATVSGESASGWQQMALAAPLAVTAGTTYIASYHAPNGRYAVTGNTFDAAVVNGPLTAPASAASGGNGVYRYGASAYPDQSWLASNYWVDVVYVTSIAPDTTPPVISAVQAGAITASSATITWTTNEASDSQVEYGTSTAYGSTTPLDPAMVTGHSVVVSGLAAGTVYNYRVKSKDAAGNLATSANGTFTTTAPDTTAPVISAVQAGSLTMSGATITWTTNEASDTQVEYGATTAYGNSTTLNTAMVTSHSAAISGLNAGTLYHYRVKSRDAAGNLATSADATFTTAPPPSCPCSLFSATATPAVTAANDTSAIELGVKFQAASNGYVSAVRFYKDATNTGTHTVSLWSTAGTRLATATVSGESASGWQQMALAAPLAVTAGTTYIASYHAPNGRYAITGNAFDAAVVSGPLTAPASAASGGNGVYRYGASAYPDQSWLNSNYWVDVVFAVVTDTTPPVVSAVTPANAATGVAVGVNLTVTFNEPVNPNTVSTASFELRDPAGALVPAAVTYDSPTRTATLNPTASLRGGLSYTATVKGGTATPQVRDDWGNALASSHVWSFTTAALPDSGPGGPVLVVTTEATPFGRYLGEILQAEGLNAYTATDITLVTAARLTGYDVVIVGEMALSAAQVTMFSDWVTAGGNLVAMRPDKKLAGLLGLTDAGASLSEGYLLVNTAAAPGTGIVGETIQYHGTADRYTLSGATAVATLYSNPTTATTSPAVTLRGVGTAGGQAAAFTYDLARSVVYTRQGNPAWAGQERDALAPVRSDDLFFGNAAGDVQPDWVNLNKVAIPQADEQQRLLLNLITEMNRDRKPLPRFWYLPRGEKAVVVMTGDDHANGGTAGRFNQQMADSPAGCVVANWECVRSTSYIYSATPLTNAQAAAYVADGFEVSIHVENGCQNWTPASLAANYSAQLAAWRAKYTSIASPATHRLHCLVWSDWATQAQIELDNGIRFDTNYYYWPGSWIANRPGFMTGSGMPMRFANLDGTIINVYQAETQMTDESGQTYPFTINALLDKAIGAEGYYGAFTANMHTDTVSSSGASAIVASALARGVPVVSAQQMLSWLDGRNSSTYSGMARSGNQLSFTITASAGANGLQSMLPVASATGSLIGLTRGGSSVAYTTELIKGVQYALFPAVSGNYVATFTSLAVTELSADDTAGRIDAGHDSVELMAIIATAAAGQSPAVAMMTAAAGSLPGSGPAAAALLPAAGGSSRGFARGTHRRRRNRRAAGPESRPGDGSRS